MRLRLRGRSYNDLGNRKSPVALIGQFRVREKGGVSVKQPSLIK